MIVLNLQCSQTHAFEGWFASSDAFESQQANGHVECPICGCTAIRRTPSAPHVHSRTPTTDVAATDPMQVQLARFVSALREASGKAEDVGDAFASEARKIHYGDAPERSIRGMASGDDVASLLDEGISVLPVPVAKKDLH